MLCKVHPELYIPPLTQTIRNTPNLYHSKRLVNGCLLGWSDLLVWYGGDGLIWWSDGCLVWGWSGVVLGYDGLIWGGSDWLLWRFGVVWWSTLEVCLRKMVWSEYWKLKRWEAELIVVNGSLREKRDSIRKEGKKKTCTRKNGKKFSLL